MSIVNDMLLDIDRQHRAPAHEVFVRERARRVEPAAQPRGLGGSGWEVFSQGLQGHASQPRRLGGGRWLAVITCALALSALAWWLQPHSSAEGGLEVAPAAARHTPAGDVPAAASAWVAPALRLKIDMGWCGAKARGGKPATRPCEPGTFSRPD